MASGVPRSRGTLIWFNEEKDLGAIRTDEGERLEFPGSAFVNGDKPVGRCAGTVVEFDEVAGEVARVAVIPQADVARARRRRR